MKHIITLIFMLLPLLATPQSTESNQLYNRANELYDAGQYDEAIILLKKCDSLDKIQLDPSHENYNRAEYGIAICETYITGQYFNARDLDEALRHQKNAVDIFKRIMGEESDEYTSALSNIAFIYNEKGDFAEAIKLENSVVKTIKKTSGEDAPYYATALFNLSHFYGALPTNPRNSS
ncbi:MAG: tetratricopeptide repeat protein [Bacteroidales bacterium]|nr:tetratricopeptide repeat protein [Bacteroidales bacterium]